MYAGELDLLAERHARYFVHYADTCAKDYDHDSMHLVVATRRIRCDMPDILIAARHVVARNQAERAYRLCGEVWKNIAYFAECLALTERVLAAQGDETVAYGNARANALITLVGLSVETMDHDRTLTRCDEALALYRNESVCVACRPPCISVSGNAASSTSTAGRFTPNCSILSATRVTCIGRPSS